MFGAGQSIVFFLIILSFELLLTVVVGQACNQNVTDTANDCISLTTTSCLGTTLTFTHTSLLFAKDSSSLSEVYEKLKLWKGLQGAPKCWEVVQPYLCSVYLPKCDNATGMVELPSKEFCTRAQESCGIVESFRGWPDFLQCSKSYFAENCQSHTYDSLTFDTTGKCNAPLVRTTNEDSWYKTIPGCGIQCKNPYYTEKDHDEVHIIIAVFGSLCIVSTLFTLLTFLIDWKTSNRYPAIILFFINACFFMGSIGWMAQFSGEARTDIVCKTDGTIRRGEPKLGSGETASCTIVFIIVYYFTMAGVIWFTMLAYAWHLTFKALGTPRDDLTSKTAYFHIASWCIPLVMTIISLAVSEIDGDSLSGICFVGYENYGYRAGFVLAPVCLALIGGLVYLAFSLKTLVKLKKETPDFISDKATSKIRETIIRLCLFGSLAFVFVLISFIVHVYVFASEQKWMDDFQSYYYCLANVTVTKSVYNTSSQKCSMDSKPSVVAMEFHIIAYFGAGIVMSSWAWTKASLLSWERFLRRIFKKPSNKPVKLKKHKMIAKAFENRKNMNNGRMSLSFGSTHDDPLGMKFDLNSVSSHEMSSNFANAMPKLVRRRGGMIIPTAGTLRRYSDSDIGSMASKMASRRQSLDSQLSQAQGQFYPSDQENEEHLPEQQKKKKKKKKKKGKNRNRINPVLGPVVVHNKPGPTRSRRHRSRSKGRRNSNSSAVSKASAHGIDFNLEKNSMEAVSVDSYSHNNSLEAVTLPPPPKTLSTNFAIFTASTYMGEVNQEVKEEEHSKKSGKNKSERRSLNGSQRSRAREVAMEMTEAHIYQEQKPNNNSNSKLGSAGSRSSRGRLEPIKRPDLKRPTGSANSRSSRGRVGSAQSKDRIEPGLRQTIGSATSKTSRGRQGSAKSDRSNVSAGPSNRQAMGSASSRSVGSANRSGQSRQSSARSNKSQGQGQPMPNLPGCTEDTVLDIEDDDDLVSVSSLE